MSSAASLARLENIVLISKLSVSSAASLARLENVVLVFKVSRKLRRLPSPL